MSDVKMNAARRDGQIVFVDDVDRGLKCNCTCVACGALVIARKGPVLEWHFAHTAEHNCAGPSYETVLHAAACAAIHRFLLAGEMLCSVGGVPVVSGGYAGTKRISDVMVGRVGIEVIVSNPLSAEKLDELKDHPMIEVPLSMNDVALVMAPGGGLVRRVWERVQTVATDTKPSYKKLLWQRAVDERRKLASEARERASLVVCQRTQETLSTSRAALQAAPPKLRKIPAVKRTPLQQVADSLEAAEATGCREWNLLVWRETLKVPPDLHEVALAAMPVSHWEDEKTGSKMAFGSLPEYLRLVGISAPTSG
jgi:hypothetical protein